MLYSASIPIILCTCLLLVVAAGTVPSQPTKLQIERNVTLTNSNNRDQSTTTTATEKTRDSNLLLISFGGFGLSNAQSTVNNNCLQDVTMYNLSATGGTNVAEANMPAPLLDFGSVLYINKIYILGGYQCDSASNVNNFSVYDILNNSWTPLAPPFEETSAHVSLLSPGDGSLYAVGGNRENFYWTFAYDVAQAKWRNVSSTPVPPVMAESEYGCGIVVDEAMYYIADSSETFVSNDRAQTWQQLASMSTRRKFAACVALPTENKIFVAGGFDGLYLNSMEVYDVGTDTWTMLAATLSTPRFGLQAVLVPGGLVNGSTTIMFCGGGNGYSTFDLCETFDWTHQRWLGGAGGAAQLSFLSSPRELFGMISAAY